MNPRIHDVLDGELSLQALAAEEVDRLLALERAIGSVSRHIRSAPAPELCGHVMTALSRQSRPSPRTAPGERARAWARQLWAPRRISFQLRPAYAMGAALASLVLMSAPMRDAPVAGPEASPPQHTPTAYVQFRLDSPGATRVELAGSFTGWKPRYTMQEREPGVWTALVPVEAGAHEYVFVVDGREWVTDPAAETVRDDFGGANSRLLVAPPHAQT